MHDVTNGISYDFDFVKWPASPLSSFLPTPLHSSVYYAQLVCSITWTITELASFKTSFSTVKSLYFDALLFSTYPIWDLDSSIRDFAEKTL